MTKYLATVGIMLMVNSEVFSLLMLMVIGLLFWLDVWKAKVNG